MNGGREKVLVIVLLAFQAAQLAYAITADGMSYDELLYVASGYRELTLGDHRFGAEQPPLAQVLAAVPLAPLDLKVRELSASDASLGWAWAHQFVHVDNAQVPLLRLARIPIAGLSLLLSIILWRWSRDAFGSTAGLSALALASFHPSLLAHGHLVTTDMAGTLTMIAASWAMWRWCAGPSAPRAAVVGAALGAAFATRLTGGVLIPVFALLAAHWWWRSGRDRGGAARVLELALACSVLVPLIIWAAYGFRYEAWPGEPEPVIASMVWAQAVQGTVGERVISLLKAAHALPAAYLASLEAYLIKSTVGHQSFLLGRISATGWWYYYVVAFAVKNTPGFLIALAVAAASWRRAEVRAARHWLLPAALMFTAASLSRVQVGERYILPVYAYLILFTASLAPKLLAEKGGRPLAALVLLLHAGPTLLSAPDGYLSYFNGLVGRELAPRVLADSNLDWGQDLPRLAAWSKAHPEKKLQLAYWGSDDPDAYGIAREDLPGQTLYPLVNQPAEPFVGWVAISPTLLSGLYPPPGSEEIYRRLRKRTPDDRAGVFMIYNLSF